MRPLSLVVISIAFFLVLFPVSMLVIGSLVSGYPWQPGTLSLDSYVKILSSSSSFIIPLRNSLLLAILSVSISLIGIPIAWIVKRTDTPGRNVFDRLCTIPFFISPLILSMAWSLLMDQKTGFVNNIFKSLFGVSLLNINSLPGIAFVSGIYYATFMYLFTAPAFSQIDPEFEEASYMLGGNMIRTALKITIPVVAPAIVSGMFIVFTLSLEEFAIPLVLGSPFNFTVLATSVWQLINFYSPPRYGEAAGLSMIFLAITVLVSYLYFQWIGNKQKYVFVKERGYKASYLRLGKVKYVFVAVCSAYVFLAFFLPVAAIFVTSLVPYLSTNLSQLIHNGITMQHWVTILSDPAFTSSLRNSLELGFAGSILAVGMGLVISYELMKSMKSKATKALVNSVTMFPASMPAPILAIGLLWGWLALPLPIYGTVWILLLAYATMRLPFGVRVLSGSLAGVHSSYEEASTMLGASWTRTLRRIVIPLQKPAIFSAWIMMFVYMFRDLTVSMMLAAPGNQVMGVFAYANWVDTGYPEASVVSVIQLMVIFVVVILTTKLLGTSLQDLSSTRSRGR